MSVPKGDGWRKMPSPYRGVFYARRSPVSGARQWFMRDVDTGEWGYHEEKDLPVGRTWGYAPVERIETPTL